MKRPARSLLFGLLSIAWLAASCMPPAEDSGPDGYVPDPNRADAGNQEPDGGQPTPVELPAGMDVTVATFNVERLFDATCDSGQCDDGDFEETPSILGIESKIGRIQDAIEVIDADVIVFQEIETEALFEQVMQPFASTYPSRVFGETGFDASLDVAIASKGDLVSSRTWRDQPIELAGGGTERFARELLELQVDVDGERVIVFGAHFISKRTSGNDARRQAEASAAAQIAGMVAAEQPEALVAIAGDLNDGPGSATLDAIASAGFVVPAAGLDLDVYYTHVFRQERQILDHVLWLDRDRVVPHPGGLEVLRDQGSSGLANSDHASVRQRLRLAQ